MGFFLIKKRDEKTEQLNLVLQNSFQGVKRDIFKIFEWLNFFYHKNIEQDKIIRELQRQMQYIPKTKEELRELIDTYYSITPLQHKVDKINQKLDLIDDSHKDIISLKYSIEGLNTKISLLEGSHTEANRLLRRLDEIKDKITYLEESQAPFKRHIEEHTIRPEMRTETPQITPHAQSVATVNNLREKLIKKIIKSSKDHVKNLIKNLIIKYGQISALHLREIIVEEQGLCSKSSFYRILEEIETDEDISVMHDKKEKKYSYNTIKNNYSKI